MDTRALIRSLDNSNAETLPSSFQLSILPANVIVGLGPTGLAFTLEAARSDSHKRPVVALTDRDSYSRQAIFRLDQDLFSYLEELTSKEKVKQYMDDKLIGPIQRMAGHEFRVIKINTLENLLWESLNHKKNVEIISIPKRGESKLCRINNFSQTISMLLANTVKKSMDNRTIVFKHLIGADGPHHSTRDLIPGCKIAYDSTQQPQLCDKYARVTYQLPPGVDSDSFRTALQNNTGALQRNLDEFKKMHWKLHSAPETRIFTIEDILFIATECPQDFLNSQEKLIDNWMKLILNCLGPKVVIDKLKLLDAGVFNVNLVEASSTIYPLPSDKKYEDEEEVHANAAYFLQAGDAMRITHFLTGSGAGTGLRQAKVWGEFLKSPQGITDFIKFHADIAVIRADNRERVEAYLTERLKREQIATSQQSEVSLEVKADSTTSSLKRLK